MIRTILPLALILALAAPVSAQRSPAAAGLFSALLPGGGQVYNGEWQKGLAFVATQAVLLNSHNGAWDGDSCQIRDDCSDAYAILATMGGLYVFQIVDAVVSAKRLNAEAVSFAPSLDPRGRFGLAVSVVR